MNEPLFRNHGRQVAALCWRPSSKKTGPVLEVLLITSRTTRRWILPKGWPQTAQTPAQSAAREAFEEAGVSGRIAARPVGHYHYLKEKKDGSGMPCSVEVFSLAVRAQAADWPEKGARELAWLPVDQAAQRVGDPGLRQLLRKFAKDHARPVRRSA